MLLIMSSWGENKVVYLWEQHTKKKAPLWACAPVLNFLPFLMLFEVPEREEQGKINKEMLIILHFG